MSRVPPGADFQVRTSFSEVWQEIDRLRARVEALERAQFDPSDILDRLEKLEAAVRELQVA